MELEIDDGQMKQFTQSTLTYMENKAKKKTNKQMSKRNGCLVHPDLAAKL